MSSRPFSYCLYEVEKDLQNVSAGIDIFKKLMTSTYKFFPNLTLKSGRSTWPQSALGLKNELFWHWIVLCTGI